MVRIVNWLLTRRCNLRCEYCGIVRVGGAKSIAHFKKNEIPAKRVITLLNKFRTYNPDIFHIFYGGEPFLRSDLSDILKFCNENDINYTIISNCTPDVIHKIERVMNVVGGFKGFTGSVDPIFLAEPGNKHSQLKSAAGFQFLLWMKKHVDNVVAEVTMTNETVQYTYDLLTLLSNVGIYSSLTAIDINKNYMYDFSAYSSRKRLLKENKKLEALYDKIMSDDSLLIHMKDEIVPELFRHVSSDYDCEMEKVIHNLTIDADGSIRTCLRIRGDNMSKFCDRDVLIMTNPYGYELDPELAYRMCLDRNLYCRGCNHTCVMMSKYVDETENEHKIIDH